MQETASQKNTETIVRSYFGIFQLCKLQDVSLISSSLADGSCHKDRVDPADTGVMQINKRYHLSKANSLNMDLDIIYGNMAYARHLYETQGTTMVRINAVLG